MLLRSVIVLFSLLHTAATFAQTAPLSAEAQIKKLQTDPNVLWVGEFYNDFIDLDGTTKRAEEDRFIAIETGDGATFHSPKQKTCIIKLQRPNGTNDDYWDTAFLSYLLDENTLSFADADLSKKLSPKEKKALVSSKGTLVKFHKSFLEQATLPEMVVGYRLRELIYYDKKTEQYQLLPIAIAPIVLLYDNNKQYIGEKLPFWLPVYALAAPINPAAAPNTPYIKSVQMHLSFEQCKALKTSQTVAKCNEAMLAKICKEKDKTFLLNAANGDNELKPCLPAKEIAELATLRDTITIFDAATFTESDSILVNSVSGEHIAALRVNHLFAWDEKKRQLSVSAYSFAPILRRYDIGGNFLHENAMFFLLPHKRYLMNSK